MCWWDVSPGVVMVGCDPNVLRDGVDGGTCPHVLVNCILHGRGDNMSLDLRVTSANMSL